MSRKGSPSPVRIRGGAVLRSASRICAAEVDGQVCAQGAVAGVADGSSGQAAAGEQPVGAVFVCPVEEFPRGVGGVGGGGGQPLVDGGLVHGGRGEVLLVEPGQEVEGGADAGAQPVARMRGERAGSTALAGAAQQGPCP